MSRRRATILALIALPALAQAADGGAGKLDDLAATVLLGLSLLLASLGFTAGMVVTQAVVPGLVRRSALLARRTLGRSLVYGLLATLVVVLGLVLAKAAPGPFGRLLATALVLPYFVLLLIGLATASFSLGESVLTASGSPREGSGPWATGSGAALLAVGNLFPIFGQAVLLVAMVAGMGAVLRQVLSRQPPAAVTAPGAAEEG